MSITISELDDYLQKQLNFDAFSDIDAVNGVQVARKQQDIKTVAFAVDSSFPTIVQAGCAFDTSADLLMVHHGMFWGATKAVVGSVHSKLAFLLSNDIALYAVHLPLDAHIPLGNNAQLASALGFETLLPFGEYKGRAIGVCGTFSQSKHRESILRTLFPHNHTWQNATYTSHYTLSIQNTEDPSSVLTAKASPLGTAFHGTEEIRSIAFVSGSMPRSVLYEAKQSNIDLIVCGDANHIMWLEAQELSMNILFAGHYYTETWGIMSLGQHLCTTFSLEGVFIHVPTQH